MNNGSAAALLTAVLLATFLAHACARESSARQGQIGGAVQDTSGAVLPGVTVYVSSTALTAPRTTTSDASGRYQFNALPVGDYELTFRLVEFTAATHPRVGVAANELTTVNGVMAPEP